MQKQFRWLLLVGGIFSVLAGLYMFIKPGVSLASLAILFSVVLLVNGIAEVVRYFSEKESRSGLILFNGILTIILALCLLSSSRLGLVSFIPYMFAFWVLVSGCTRLIVSFSERKNNKKDANHMLLIGILGILAGMFLFSHPLFTGLMVVYMIGFGLVYQGIANFILFHKLGK